MNNLSIKVEALEARIQQLEQKDAPKERVLRTMLKLKDENNIVKNSIRNIGMLSVVSPSYVLQLLKKFEQEGKIKRFTNKIQIIL